MWRFLKDLEIEIPFDPAIPLLGIYPKDYKSFYYKDVCTQMFTAALFTIVTVENVSHIHRGILCSQKNDEFVSFVGTWMNLETIILSKLTQEQKIKHCIFSVIGRC